MIKSLALVFIGGGFGSAFRFLLVRFLNNFENHIPYGTFIANISGSLFIGIILGLALKNNALSENTTLLLATGFCGGFTTFSSFAFENHLLLKNGEFVLFAAYTMGSIALGIAAVMVGLWLTKAF